MFREYKEEEEKEFWGGGGGEKQESSVAREPGESNVSGRVEE